MTWPVPVSDRIDPHGSAAARAADGSWSRRRAGAAITGDAAGGVTGCDMGDATRWLTYDDMATALGITPELATRLAMRRKWPRRPGNDGRALIAVPEDRLDQAAQHDTDDSAGESRDAKALIGFPEHRINKLPKEIAEARTDARSTRFETESLHPGRTSRRAGGALRDQADPWRRSPSRDGGAGRCRRCSPRSNSS